MTRQKVRRPWEETKESVHSLEGVEDLRKVVRNGLIEFYTGIGESMWQHQLDDPMTEDMRLWSRDTMPEKGLMQSGELCWFEYGGQLHCLPVVYSGHMGIYGYQSSWSPMPYGYRDKDPSTHSAGADEIRNLKLDYTNSVIMRNDIFSGSDGMYIEKVVGLLVDSVLTLNQLQMLARLPFILNCTEEQQVDARCLFQAVGDCRPFIMRNSMEQEKPTVTEKTASPIDSALFDIMSKWENLILKQLGIPMSANDSQKRAQQSVAEVQLVSGDDQVSIRRKEKLWQREKAYERINAMFGTNLSVVSVIDSMEDDKEAAAEDEMNKEENDNDTV